jgi:small subunit ribosomal protein S20
LANTAQAKKRIRQAEKRRQHNASLRSRFRTTLKKVLVAINTGVKTTAQTAFQEAVPVIDGMVNKGIIHKNKAARHKSRLNARIKALAA